MASVSCSWLLLLTFTYLTRVSFSTKLLVISLDGFRYDYLTTYQHLLPNLTYLASNGVHAVNGMKSTMATMTFPAHYTMATGLNEDTHGLVANAFYDPTSGRMFEKNSPDRMWYGGEPIWVTAKKQNLKTAVIIWIGNTVNWGKEQPDYNLPFTPNVTYEERIDKALTLLNSDTNFTMVYIDEPDSTQHSNGTFSLQLEKTLMRLDKLLSPVVANVTRGPLAGALNVIILADHGMLNVTNIQRINMTSVLSKVDTAPEGFDQFNVSKAQRDALVKDNFVWADSGVVTHIYVKRNDYNSTLVSNLLRLLITTNDTTTIWTAMNNTVHNISSVNGVIEWNNLTFYLRSQLPERWHYSMNRRIGDLVIIAKPGAMVNTLPSPVPFWRHAANHGYDNDLREMRALFIGYGPYFKQAYKLTEAFPQNCIYSLMCDILSIKPAPNNGTIEPFKSAKSASSSASLSFLPIILLALVAFAF